MTIKAIHTVQEHADAIDMIRRIMMLNRPDEADLAMLETLGILVERYEEHVLPMERPDPIDAIRFRMDQMDLNQTELSALIGFPKSRISELLSGKRSLTLDMIRALHDKLGIPSDILIGREQLSAS